MTAPVDPPRDSPREPASRPSSPSSSKTTSSTSSARWYRYAILALVVLFLVAAGVQWWQGRGVRADLARTRAELAQVTSEALIYGAAVEAQQGRYEQARQLASRFFTDLQQRALAAPTEQRATMQSILAERDATITLLSRGDAASVGALSRVASRYRALLHGDA